MLTTFGDAVIAGSHPSYKVQPQVCPTLPLLCCPHLPILSDWQH